jgi:hypothetical protein
LVVAAGFLFAIAEILDAAARRGADYLAKVINQSKPRMEGVGLVQPEPYSPVSLALMRALENADRSALELLLERPATELFPRKDGFGFNAFNICFSCCNQASDGVALAKYLLERAAAQQDEKASQLARQALDLADSDGVRPVHYASFLPTAEALQFLLDQGVNPRLRFVPSENQPVWNPSRVSALLFCRLITPTVELLCKHIPLDERYSADDSTMALEQVSVSCVVHPFCSIRRACVLTGSVSNAGRH